MLLPESLKIHVGHSLTRKVSRRGVAAVSRSRPTIGLSLKSIPSPPQAPGQSLGSRHALDRLVVAAHLRQHAGLLVKGFALEVEKFIGREQTETGPERGKRKVEAPTNEGGHSEIHESAGAIDTFGRSHMLLELPERLVTCLTGMVTKFFHDCLLSYLKAIVGTRTDNFGRAQIDSRRKFPKLPSTSIKGLR